MKYSFNEILISYIKEKKQTDGTLTRLIYRPISYPFAWFFLNMNFMPNTITYLSILVCAVGFVLSFFHAAFFQFFATGCFILFAILDCVDGNMARTMDAKGIERKNAFMGSWTDAVGGYCAYTFIILSMGVSASFASGRFSQHIIIVSAVSSSANMLMRAVVQAYKLAAGTDTKTAAGKSKRLSEEIGITGWLPILYLAGIAADFLPAVVLSYAAVYCGGCFITVLKLILKVERQK